MRHLAIHRAARCLSFVAPLLLTLVLLSMASPAFAATVGDQVELKATQTSGVPFHNAPGGTPKFQRVPSGAVGMMTSGFCRRKERSAVAKFNPMLSRICTWLIPWRLNSTGSSAVMMFVSC
jgi:hypothetical protein